MDCVSDGVWLMVVGVVVLEWVWVLVFDSGCLECDVVLMCSGEVGELVIGVVLILVVIVVFVLLVWL